MMIDEDLVATSPATVYRVLKDADVMRKWKGKKSKKGTGFNQPKKPHEHWHTDISYINICGTFYYFSSVLDGYSRFMVHWEIREKMEEKDIEVVIQRAKEKYPNTNSRIISDNGAQYVSKDFKEFIRISGLTHVKTSPYYPQSNGKIERFHKSYKTECIRKKIPVSIENARDITTLYIDNYNCTRLHSALGYITPETKLKGTENKIFHMRKERLLIARKRRNNIN